MLGGERLKVGWLSASPTAQTGYGKQTLEVCSRLLRRHEVTCIGQVGEPIVWGQRQKVSTVNGDLWVLSLSEPAADLINRLYLPEFKFDVMIGFMDAFGLEFLNDAHVPCCFWIPIDGPFTDKWRNFMRNAYRVLAYSQFGYRELLKWYPEGKVSYIPHGMDTSVFKPLSEEDRLLARVELEEERGIPRNAFLAVHVGANVGPRKCIPLLMDTWSRFAHGRNAYLYVHTNAYSVFPRGYDLISWRGMVKADKNVVFPLYDPILKPTPDPELARLYGAADLYVSDSVAEGFGLPLLEAMSCGVPCVAPRNSTQVELIEGRGWLVENVPEDDFYEVPVYVPLLTRYPAPSQRSLLEKLEEAYENPDQREKYGGACREFALRYSWENVMPLWYRFLEQVESELTLFKELEAGLKA